MSDAQPLSEQTPQPNRRGAFFILFFSLMAIGAGNTMLIAAVIPPLTRTLALPDWMAGAIFSLSALCWSLSSPFWGTRSNKYGRRRITGPVRENGQGQRPRTSCPACRTRSRTLFPWPAAPPTSSPAPPETSAGKPAASGPRWNGSWIVLPLRKRAGAY